MWWHVEAQNFCGPNINDQLKLRWQLDRQVADFLTLQNPGGVYASTAVSIHLTGAVAQQATRYDKCTGDPPFRS